MPGVALDELGHRLRPFDQSADHFCVVAPEDSVQVLERRLLAIFW
jgi:hypothetical protein